jgi:Ulp1 family protease
MVGSSPPGFEVKRRVDVVEFENNPDSPHPPAPPLTAQSVKRGKRAADSACRESLMESFIEARESLTHEDLSGLRGRRWLSSWVINPFLILLALAFPNVSVFA